jgi:excisionase family DNA binding protein
MAGMDGEMLTVTQAAERLGLHRDTLLRQIAKGVLPARRLGSIWVVSGAAVERYRHTHLGKHGFASPDHPRHGPRAAETGQDKA